MLYVTPCYIDGKLWISKNNKNELYYVGFKEFLIQDNVSKFSLFKSKVLAIKKGCKIYIYYFNKFGLDVEDALTLICILNENNNFDLAVIYIDNICYNIDKNCNIYIANKK